MSARYQIGCENRQQKKLLVCAFQSWDRLQRDVTIVSVLRWQLSTR
jgi:hypothetical protein